MQEYFAITLIELLFQFSLYLLSFNTLFFYWVVVHFPDSQISQPTISPKKNFPNSFYQHLFPQSHFPDTFFSQQVFFPNM